MYIHIKNASVVVPKRVHSDFFSNFMFVYICVHVYECVHAYAYVSVFVSV